MSTSGPPRFGDPLAELPAVIGTVFVSGPPVLVAWAGAALFALVLAGPFALLLTLVVALIAVTALVALAAAILATPYLLFRHLRGHWLRRTTSDVEPQLVAVEPQRAGA